MGLSNDQIASIVTGYFNKSGRQGEFLASVIKNMMSKHQVEVDLLAGIEKDFSIAQKTLSRLNEWDCNHTIPYDMFPLVSPTDKLSITIPS